VDTEHAAVIREVIVGVGVELLLATMGVELLLLPVATMGMEAKRKLSASILSSQFHTSHFHLD